LKILSVIDYTQNIDDFREFFCWNGFGIIKHCLYLIFFFLRKLNFGAHFEGLFLNSRRYSLSIEVILILVENSFGDPY